MPERLDSISMPPSDETPEGDYEYWMQHIPRDEWPGRSVQAENLTRRSATPEETERMDRELVGLGKLMEDFTGWWQLDGSLNISLVNGSYIGAHADVDMSLLRDDMPALEHYFKERGYGFFLTKKHGEGESKTRTFRRTGEKQMKGDTGWQYRVARLGEHGKIDVTADLFRIDLHIIERNEHGELINLVGLSIPNDWLNGETIDFKGTKIHLSNPARFVFNKIFFDRGYDFDDLKQYVRLGAITSDELRSVIIEIDRAADADAHVEPHAERAKNQILTLIDIAEVRSKRALD